MRSVSAAIAVAGLAFVLLGSPWNPGGRMEAQAVHGKSGATEAQACLDAARAKLGPSATVLRCGYLSKTEALEVLSIIRLRSARARKGCLPVSHLVMLRKERAGWLTALEAAKVIRNPAGYVATDYLDASDKFFGYCLETADKRSDDFPAFTIFLTDISPDGSGASSTEISWNEKAGRYQQFADVEGFKPEVKNPPHIDTSKGCCGQSSATATPAVKKP